MTETKKRKLYKKETSYLEMLFLKVPTVDRKGNDINVFEISETPDAKGLCAIIALSHDVYDVNETKVKAEIIKLEVADTKQNQGIGKQVIAEFLVALKENAEKQNLDITHIEAAAHLGSDKFWLSCGFKPTNNKYDYHDGKTEPVSYYEYTY